MEVRTEVVGPAVVLSLGGRLTVEEDARRLHLLARSAARLHPNVIVLDLGRLRQIDCSGIGQLVRVWHEVQGPAVRVALVNVPDTVLRLLTMFGLVVPFWTVNNRKVTQWIARAREDRDRLCMVGGGPFPGAPRGMAALAPKLAC